MDKKKARKGSGLRKQIKARAERTGESYASAFEALRKRTAKKRGETVEVDPAQVEAGMRALAVLMAPENVERMKTVVSDAVRAAPIVAERIKRNIATLTSPESLDQIRVGIARAVRVLPIALDQTVRAFGVLFAPRSTGPASGGAEDADAAVPLATLLGGAGVIRVVWKNGAILDGFPYAGLVKGVFAVRDASNSVHTVHVDDVARVDEITLAGAPTGVGWTPRTQ
ncbi:MAG: hypothetical protein KA297_00440 [Kofleriaceae bacterium]|nr:hypothetical protein [Kofleriaceae bacterium]